MRCPEAARLKWTARDQAGKPVCESVALSVTEKAPEQSGKADARVVPRQRANAPRMGSRCWCGGGREALVWPKQIRGRKLTSVCRQVALA